MARPVHVGLIGCGRISDAYFAGCASCEFIKCIARGLRSPCRHRERLCETAAPARRPRPQPLHA